MKYKEWLEESKKECEFLDTIDIKKYLKTNEDVWVCMQKIKEENDKEYCRQYNDDFGLFNCVGESDFIDYIKCRYPEIGINESITYYIYNLDDE